MTFTQAWGGESQRYVVIAHTKRDDVIVTPMGETSPVYLLHGAAGWGGSITRQCKTLDAALDLAIKAGKVWNHLATSLWVEEA